MTRSGLSSSLQLFHDGFCKAIRRTLATKVRGSDFRIEKRGVHRRLHRADLWLGCDLRPLYPRKRT